MRSDVAALLNNLDTYVKRQMELCRTEHQVLFARVLVILIYRNEHRDADSDSFGDAPAEETGYDSMNINESGIGHEPSEEVNIDHGSADEADYDSPDSGEGDDGPVPRSLGATPSCLNRHLSLLFVAWNVLGERCTPGVAHRPNRMRRMLQITEESSIRRQFLRNEC